MRSPPPVWKAKVRQNTVILQWRKHWHKPKKRKKSQTSCGRLKLTFLNTECLSVMMQLLFRDKLQWDCVYTLSALMLSGTVNCRSNTFKTNLITWTHFERSKTQTNTIQTVWASINITERHQCGCVGRAGQNRGMMGTNHRIQLRLPDRIILQNSQIISSHVNCTL